MNLKYKKYPALKHLANFRKKGGRIQLGYDPYFPKDASISNQEDCAEVLAKGIKEYQLFSFSKTIADKIESQKVNFLKDLSTYLKQNISDEGIIITPTLTVVYEISKKGKEHDFIIHFLVESDNQLYVIASSYGTTKQDNNQIIIGFARMCGEKTMTEESIRFLTFNLFQYIIFKKFAPIETKQVKGLRSSKSFKQIKGKSIDVTHITSDWFTNLIRSDGFSVKGHFALRACGVGRKDRRLVWINPFEKSGYTRTAKIVSS